MTEKMETDFVLATMPQEDPVASNPPVLPDKHVYIAHGNNELARDWSLGMGRCLQNEGFQVIQVELERNGERPTAEKIAFNIRRAMKVIMLIDKYVVHFHSQLF